MEKKVCIMGTCRVSNLLGLTWEYLNYFSAGGHSKLYEYNGIKILAQPVTYTTKLADTRDALLYMRGLLYEGMDPNHDETFFHLFFRGLSRYCFDAKLIKRPGEVVYGVDNHFSAYIFEINSLREILFKNNKYGDVYVNKNLPWNLDIGAHNTVTFDKDDFVMMDNKNDLGRICQIFSEINHLCDYRPILIVGPYLLPNDTREKEKWGENDVLDPNEYVNRSRRWVQDVLKIMVDVFPNMEYFDMTRDIAQGDFLLEQYHFNDAGNRILTAKMLDFIDRHVV